MAWSEATDHQREIGGITIIIPPAWSWSSHDAPFKGDLEFVRELLIDVMEKCTSTKTQQQIYEAIQLLVSTWLLSDPMVYAI